MIAFAIVIPILAILGLVELVVRYALATILLVVFLVLSLPFLGLPLIWANDNFDSTDLHRLLSPVCFSITQVLTQRLAVASNNAEYTAFLEERLNA